MASCNMQFFASGFFYFTSRFKVSTMWEHLSVSLYCREASLHMDMPHFVYLSCSWWTFGLFNFFFFFRSQKLRSGECSKSHIVSTSGGLQQTVSKIARTVFLPHFQMVFVCVPWGMVSQFHTGSLKTKSASPQERFPHGPSQGVVNGASFSVWSTDLTF